MNKTQLTYFKNVRKVLRQKLGDEETTTLLARAVDLINNSSSNNFLVYHLVHCIILIIRFLVAYLIWDSFSHI